MLQKYPEFGYLADDVVAEAQLRLVQILQPDRLKWDENKEKSENFGKINTFVRIAIRNHCIDTFRKEGFRATKLETRSDIDHLAKWSDGWQEMEALEALTAEETVIIGLFFQELEIEEIRNRLGWNTQKEVTAALEAIATKVEATRANTRPAAAT
jgi:DNA-directed RNA polymerase specialized sigma24 family protein